MKIAHFSDTHLGYSRFAPIDERGLNQRMVDVVTTFDRYLESILAEEPDIVVHSGDFFHMSRPPNNAITAAYRRLVKFQADRGRKPFLLASGNHDSPKSIGVGNILRIFGGPEPEDHAIPGMRIVESSAARLRFDNLSFEALVLPWSGENPGFAIEPASAADVSLLVAHGLEQSLNIQGATLSLSRLSPEKWSYVALGDYHINKQLAPNVHYCGSTDYTSTNFWEEIPHRKGWLLFDSDKNAVKFKPVEPARPAILLDDIDASGLSGSEIGEEMERRLTWDTESKPLVRQVVRNCDPRARAEVPAEVFQTLRGACLFYDADLRLQSRTDDHSASEQSRGTNLREDWAAFAAERKLPLGIDRDDFVDTGIKWMKEAEGDSQED